jgi:hypothetical protein
MSQTFTFPIRFQQPVTVSQGLTGTFYGDGSNLVGTSLPGQQEVNSIVESTSGNTLFLNDYVQETVNDIFGIYFDQAEDSYTTVRSNSSNWNSAYQRVSANDLVRSNQTLETPTTGLSTINNIISLSQATYDALTIKLPTTLYVIV